MALTKNSIIPLKITALSSDGNGIGRHDGQAVFVPVTAIGDELEVKIVKVCKNYAFGIIDAFINKSSERIEPNCDVYKQCGGCNFRHISYAAELAAKEQFVADAMLRLGHITTACNKILPSPQEEGYRNKVQYPLTVQADGKIAIGFYAGRSHRVIPCPTCMLQPGIITEILTKICDLLTQFKISIYNEEQHTGLVRHLYLRHAVHTEQIMVCFVLNGSKLPFAQEIVAALTADFENIASVLININKQQTNVVLGQTCKTLYGQNYIDDILCGVPVKLYPLSFYQVNTLGAEQLYRTVKQLANPTKDDILLDLYCGAGTIGLSMADSCRELIGVEIVPQAIESATQNAEAMQLTNTRFICSDAGKAATLLAKEKLAPDIIILDPPRKGCDTPTLDAVCTMNPKTIVMVSCNASTAARDVKYLSENGYEIKVIQPVDMFPRTKHVEAIILMTYCGDKTINES